MKSTFEETLSLATFHSETRRYRRAINLARNSVSRVRNLFSQEEEIWPDQCDYARASIDTLLEPIQKFSELLDNASYLPAGAIPFRYSLVVSLHKVEGLLDELSILIIRFRTLCRTSTSEAIKQRRAIARKLDELEQECKDLLPDTGGLLLQVLSSREAGTAVVGGG